MALTLWLACICMYAERGYRLIFDHEMQIEVRNTNQDAVESVGMLETLRIKVFITVTNWIPLPRIGAHSLE